VFLEFAMTDPRPTRRLSAALASLSGLVLAAAGGCATDGGSPATADAGITGPQLAARPMARPEPTFGTRDAWARRGDPALGRFDMPTSLDPARVAELRSASVNLLVRAAGSNIPLLRANALEALGTEPQRLLPAVRLGLGDENRGVRFTAVMMVGRERITPLAPLVEPLLADPSGSVRAAAIYALSRCGRPVDPTPLAGMLLGDSLEERGNAAMVLGMLGEDSALELLRSAYGRTVPTAGGNALRSVDMQIAEAAYRLGGSVSDLELIRAALLASGGEEEIAALAAQICGELRDEASLRTLAWIATRNEVPENQPPAPAEVRMAAATAIARMRPDQAPVRVLLGYVGSDNPALRAQAAVGLGWFRDAQVLPTLATMLEDRNAMVQVAAAGSIVRATAGVTRPGPVAMGRR
jgi:HEAT repeat protein